jgi:threonine dehydratase
MSADVMIGAPDIAAAADRLRPHVHRTPVLTSRSINECVGGQVFFKCENLQRVGAFKFRGAMNAVLQLSEADKKRGVVTHSSGNHAQALALAGRLAGVPVCVVMPRTAPAVKREATQGYGAQIVACEPTQQAREAAVAEQVAKHGYVLVHPYDDWRVIAGQGTAALELLEQAGPLDVIATPCGGGGLLSGTALWATSQFPTIRVVGCEPARADDAKRSLETGTIHPSGDPKTIADGLRTSLGPKTFAVIRRHVSEIVTADEAEILGAMRLIWERLKLVVEPSGAVPLACMLKGRIDLTNKRVGVILSGGNVELGPYFESLAVQI